MSCLVALALAPALARVVRRVSHRVGRTVQKLNQSKRAGYYSATRRADTGEYGRPCGDRVGDFSKALCLTRIVWSNGRSASLPRTRFQAAIRADEAIEETLGIQVRRFRWTSR